MEKVYQGAHRRSWDAMVKPGPTLIFFLVGIAPLELNGFYNSYLSQAPFWYWTVETLTWLFLPAAIFLAGCRQGGFSPGALGFHLRVFGQRKIWAFLLTLIVLSQLMPSLYELFQNWARLLFPINWGGLAFDYRDMVPPGGFGRILVLCYLAITAGVVEEMYFRGILRLFFTKSIIGNLSYVFLSSLLFASIHWEGGIWNMFETFLFGCLTSLLYVSLGNIWPIILGHAYTDYIRFS